MNDLRPLRKFFRNVFRKQADEKGIKLQIPPKTVPPVILTDEMREATIRAAYSTSSS